MLEDLRRALRPARQAAHAGLRTLGAFRAISRSRWRQRRLLILCYHGVSLRDEHEWNGRLFVTPAFLRRRFEILRDGGYRVLPLGEAVSALERGTLPPRSVAITFDDGFHNYHAAAAPLLEAFGFPATNYMSSYYCVNQRPVPILALRYLLWRARARVLPALTLPGQGAEVDLRDAPRRERFAVELLADPAVLAGGESAQQALLPKVAARLGYDWDAIVRDRLFHLMTPAEVAEMARRGHDLQLHTHRHRTPRERSAFCHEVAENRRILEEMTGRRAQHFCYPSGDVDAMFLPWLRELGVQTATTTGEAGLARADHDRLLLPRFVDTMAQPEVMFESWLSGAGALLRRASS